MLFDDGPTDAYYKRFARDRLRYTDDVFCAAGAVARALSSAAGGGSYHAAHVRRGELQFVSVRISAHEWNATLSEWVPPGAVLFVLSDEVDATWFAPIEAQFRVFFLRDFEAHVAALDDPNARGMVEQLVAAAPPSASFTGTFFSTFSSYVARLRAYYGHAADTFFYAAPRAKHRVLHDTRDAIAPPFYNREWPLAWNALRAAPPRAGTRGPVARLPPDLGVADLAPQGGAYPVDRVKRALAKEKQGAPGQKRPPR